MTGNDIVLKIENVNSWLLTHDHQLKTSIHNLLRFRPKDFWHNSAYKNKKWDGYKDFFDDKTGKFMTGLLPEVQKYLKLKNRTYTTLDTRTPFEWLNQSIDDQFLNNYLPDGVDPITLHDFQPDLANQCFKHNRGIVTAPTGCHRKGQLILMFDGSTKKVEDIKVNDILMGPHGSPRKVLSLCRGVDAMYQVSPTKGKPFVVNGDHVLSLIKTPNNHNRYPSEVGGQIIDVTVREWNKWSKWKKHIHKLFRTEVDFGSSNKEAQIDPYFLGLLLGDGSMQTTPAITTADTSVIAVCEGEAAKRDLHVIERKAGGESNSYYITHGIKGLTNPLSDSLRELGLWGKACGDKFIPHQYKTATKENRLKVLAGIIDADGHLNNKGYDINLKSKQLVWDIAFIARSLGFAAYVKENIKASQNGTKGIYHRVYISGDVCRIPCKIKSALPRKQKKDVLRTGFKIEKISNSERYYGFTVDQDHRYLLDDFTVTHNSGKTFILVSVLKSMPPKTPCLFLTKNAQLVDQNWQEMKTWGVPNLGRWYGDYKEPNYVMCATVHQKTFESLRTLLPKFKVLLVDEVHDCLSDVPVAAYKKMTAAQVRLGFSATPFKWAKKKIDDVHKWSVKSHFGPLFKTTTTESGFLTTKDLQERNILSKSDCSIYTVDKPNLAYEPYQDAVKLGIEQNFYFHEIVKNLARSCPGRTLIVVERIEQGEYLKSLMPEAIFMQGSTSLRDRVPTINALRSGDKFIGIVMRQIITAGINIKIHDLINAAGGEGAHNVIQLMGRGLRTASDKDLLRYHDFLFTINDYLNSHSEWRIEVLKKEGHQVTMKGSL